jgi:hypothetical protein
LGDGWKQFKALSSDWLWYDVEPSGSVAREFVRELSSNGMAQFCRWTAQNFKYLSV